MYTGMATCTGLSLYFFKMALLEEDLPETRKTAQFTKHIATAATKNKRFFFVCGTAWAVAAAYRWHLG
jgi:UDP-N-acetyl-D-mannosaminuronic acid transferase (WecB/TagA/CpsF family)